MASQKSRDLGGQDLIEVYQFLRKVWWLRAPLFHRDHPTHPMWKLGFFDEARRDGTWDRWCEVVLGWHAEVDGLMDAFASPVGAIANALPPQLLVAKLMESVKVLTCHCAAACACMQKNGLQLPQLEEAQRICHDCMLVTQVMCPWRHCESIQ